MKTFTVQTNEGHRLDRWLADQCEGRARNQIQLDLQAQRVRVNGELHPARYRVRLGDEVAYDQPEVPEREGLKPEAIPLDILFEDEHLIVINKPAGLVVHPAPGHASGTLANALLAHCGPSLEGVGGEDRWGIVHRLDNLTSGLMMAAKTQQAHEVLVAALARHEVRRHYLGVVIGSFKTNTGTIDQPIGRRKSDRKKMGIRSDGREARTDWRLLCQDKGLSLLALRLQTGRTHQIRVHLQSIGRPILADPDYGWTRPRTMHALPQTVRTHLMAIWPDRQMLHAARLAFSHPVDKDRLLDLHCPLPEDFERLCEEIWGEMGREKLASWHSEPLAIDPDPESPETPETPENENEEPTPTA